MSRTDAVDTSTVTARPVAPQAPPPRAAPDAQRERGDAVAASAPTRRLRSLDAIRGLAIVIMLLAGNPFPREHLWTQLRHPEWHGLSFADLFFPLFLFAVGAAMTLSSRSGSPRQVLRRAVILVLLGIALTSLKHESLGIFGVLQHIAISYVIAWVVLQAPRRAEPLLAAAILAITWVAYISYAGPGSDPWGQQDTFAHAASSAVTGGFSTEGLAQSFTSAVNVLAGAFIARGMRTRRAGELVPWIARHALWVLVVAALLAFFIPINKRLWTPSFAMLSIATSCMWLALFAWIADVRRWNVSKPLEQLGANPIAVYVVFMAATALLAPFRGWWPDFAIFGNHTFGTTAYGLGWLFLAWLFAWWLYRRRIFFKV